MPAIVTHHLFGQDASTHLPQAMLPSQEERIAFLLGSQGTDPLFARFRCSPHSARTCHTFARAMHEGNMVSALCSLRTAATQLSARDIPVGRAFVLGMAAHYLLDSITHPLILALVKQITDADPALTDAQSEIHALIEADIDSWLLWQKRHKTILEAPASDALVSTGHVDRIASGLMAYVANDVFNMAIGRSDFARSVRDYRLVYRLVDSRSRNLTQGLTEIERLRRPFSRIMAQRHPLITSDECASANLDHRHWRNPFTGEISVASFPDLFHDALGAWPVFCQRLIEGDHLRLAAMVDGINYYGKPITV